jgi:hypothetical protein
VRSAGACFGYGKWRPYRAYDGKFKTKIAVIPHDRPGTWGRAASHSGHVPRTFSNAGTAAQAWVKKKREKKKIPRNNNSLSVRRDFSVIRRLRNTLTFSSAPARNSSVLWRLNSARMILPVGRNSECSFTVRSTERTVSRNEVVSGTGRHAALIRVVAFADKP